MKKLCLFVLFCMMTVTATAGSRTINGINDNEQLGMMAGLALACNAGGKLDDYELIASRILANTVQTDAEEKKAVQEYAQAKFKAYKEQKNTPQATCGEILDTFNHLPIFKSIVYANGTVKMPDGRILKSRKTIQSGRTQTVNKKK